MRLAVLSNVPRLMVLFFLLLVGYLAGISLFGWLVLDMPLSHIEVVQFLEQASLVFLLLPYVLILSPIVLFAMVRLVVTQPTLQYDPHKPLPFFTIIIPAYNEEKVIANSVRTMLQQDYPAHSFKVVVAFNGNDRSGEIAQQLGATVYTTPQVGVGKRNAISYVLKHLPVQAQGSYILILDADNLVKKDFLQQMAAVICQPHAVLAVQGNHQPLVVSKNWVSRGLSAAYRASSLLYNEGRSLSCQSALLCGTGFAIREDVFRDLWPKTKTLTEDIELNGLLLQHYNSGVVWANQAVFYDEKPDNLSIAIRQRTRWMAGHFWCGLLYAAGLIGRGIWQRDLRRIELGSYYLFPFALLSSVLLLALVAVQQCCLANTELVSHPWQLAWSGALLLFYLFYIVLGDAMTPQAEPKTGWQRLIDAACGALFALLVWPVAIIRACFMLQRKDWIFHTPHKSNGHEQSLS